MERPKYHLLQNIGYMIRAAWEMRKSVLGLLVISSILTVANSTAELLVVPAILNKVETKAPISALLATILMFTVILLVLTSTKTYVEANTMFGQMEVQSGMLWRVCHKSVTTSYPNMEEGKNKFLKEGLYLLGSQLAAREVELLDQGFDGNMPEELLRFGLEKVKNHKNIQYYN